MNKVFEKMSYEQTTMNFLMLFKESIQNLQINSTRWDSWKNGQGNKENA